MLRSPIQPVIRKPVRSVTEPRPKSLAQAVRAILAALRQRGVTISNQLIHEQWAYQQRMLALYPGDASKCVLFQDSAGTLPVTSMEQQIGLALDLETAGVRGVELLSDWGFDSGVADWPSIARGTTEHVGSAMRLTTTSTVSTQFGVVVATALNILQPQTTYEVEVVVSEYSTASLSHQFLLSLSSGQNSGVSIAAGGSVPITGPGVFRGLVFTSDALRTLTLSSRNGTATVGDTIRIESISFRPIPGCHMIQPTAPKRAIMSKRVNLLVGTAELATQTVTVIAGSHRLQFSGAGTVTLSGAATGALSAGSHTITTTAGSLTLTVSGAVTFADLRPTADVHPSVSAYQRVTSPTDYDTAGFVVTKRWDGTDDAYASAGTLDLTGTDEVTVFAPVLKESDAAVGMALEFGPTSSVNGSFYLAAPVASSGGNSQSFAAASRGSTTGVTTIQTGHIAPKKALLSLDGNLQEPFVRLRVNGAGSVNTADQGTGNYGNHTVFEGARNQTSLPLKGRSGGWLAVGEVLPPGQQAIMERWVNGFWRAY